MKFQAWVSNLFKSSVRALKPYAEIVKYEDGSINLDVFEGGGLGPRTFDLTNIIAQVERTAVVVDFFVRKFDESTVPPGEDKKSAKYKCMQRLIIAPQFVEVSAEEAPEGKPVKVKAITFTFGKAHFRMKNSLYLSPDGMLSSGARDSKAASVREGLFPSFIENEERTLVPAGPCFQDMEGKHTRIVGEISQEKIPILWKIGKKTYGMDIETFRFRNEAGENAIFVLTQAGKIFVTRTGTKIPEEYGGGVRANWDCFNLSRKGVFTSDVPGPGNSRLQVLASRYGVFEYTALPVGSYSVGDQVLQVTHREEKEGRLVAMVFNFLGITFGHTTNPETGDIFTGEYVELQRLFADPEFQKNQAAKAEAIRKAREVAAAGSEEQNSVPVVAEQPAS